MERKGVSSTVVEAEEVRAALKKARTLSSEEEKVVRMRYGVGEQDARSPLPRAAGANAELGDELLLLEMQLLKAYRMQKTQARAPERTTAAAPRSAAKDKIVRALRKKK